MPNLSTLPQESRMTAIAERPTKGRHRVAAPAPAASAVPAAPRSLARRSAGRLVAMVATLALLVAAFCLAGMTIGPRVFHYRTATMLTGSMVPTINPGDVIVDTQEPSASLRVGQIITYHIPVDDHHVESHRVTWVHVTKTGAVLFRTKGDANNGPDPWTARSAPNTDVWIVHHVLRSIGATIRFLRQPLVQLTLTRILPGLLVLYVLISIWRRPSSRRDDADSVPTEPETG
jgi:signal peptidase